VTAIPHLEKIKALESNEKLPSYDRGRLPELRKRYTTWKAESKAAHGTPTNVLSALTNALNRYKMFVEFDFIFASKEDFLYRQKGQLKLDNTILEEFLPMLVDPRLVPEMSVTPTVNGPTKCYAGMSFSGYGVPLSEGGAFVKTKDQDFALGSKFSLELSNGSSDFHSDLQVAYLVAELKTNLDKTMFQEASATASELKSAVSSARYFLLCEWLDMTPIDTRLTAIDKVIVLRKAKRMGSDQRRTFSSASARQKAKSFYKGLLSENPISEDALGLFLKEIRSIFSAASTSVDVALGRGWF